MTRTQLLLRLLLKAAWVRKDRAFTALVSVAVVATIATAALTIYSDLESKLSREFRGFGANIVVTKNSGALTAGELAGIHKIVGNGGEIMPVGLRRSDLQDGSSEISCRRHRFGKAAQDQHVMVFRATQARAVRS